MVLIQGGRLNSRGQVVLPTVQPSARSTTQIGSQVVSTPTVAKQEQTKVNIERANQGNFQEIGFTKTVYQDIYDKNGNVVGQEKVQVADTSRGSLVTSIIGLDKSSDGSYNFGGQRIPEENIRRDEYGKIIGFSREPKSSQPTIRVNPPPSRQNQLSQEEFQKVEGQRLSRRIDLAQQLKQKGESINAQRVLESERSKLDAEIQGVQGQRFNTNTGLGHQDLNAKYQAEFESKKAEQLRNLQSQRDLINSSIEGLRQPSGSQIREAQPLSPLPKSPQQQFNDLALNRVIKIAGLEAPPIQDRPPSTLTSVPTETKTRYNPLGLLTGNAFKETVELPKAQSPFAYASDFGKKLIGKQGEKAKEESRLELFGDVALAITGATIGVISAPVTVPVAGVVGIAGLTLAGIEALKFGTAPSKFQQEVNLATEQGKAFSSVPEVKEQKQLENKIKSIDANLESRKDYLENIQKKLDLSNEKEVKDFNEKVNKFNEILDERSKITDRLYGNVSLKSGDIGYGNEKPLTQLTSERYSEIYNPNIFKGGKINQLAFDLAFTENIPYIASGFIEGGVKGLRTTIRNLPEKNVRFDSFSILNQARIGNANINFRTGTQLFIKESERVIKIAGKEIAVPFTKTRAYFVGDVAIPTPRVVSSAGLSTVNKNIPFYDVYYGKGRLPKNINIGLSLKDEVSEILLKRKIATQYIQKIQSQLTGEPSNVVLIKGIAFQEKSPLIVDIEALALSKKISPTPVSSDSFMTTVFGKSTIKTGKAGRPIENLFLSQDISAGIIEQELSRGKLRDSFALGEIYQPKKSTTPFVSKDITFEFNNPLVDISFKDISKLPKATISNKAVQESLNQVFENLNIQSQKIITKQQGVKPNVFGLQQQKTITNLAQSIKQPTKQMQVTKETSKQKQIERLKSKQAKSQGIINVFSQKNMQNQIQKNLQLPRVQQKQLQRVISQQNEIQEQIQRQEQRQIQKQIQRVPEIFAGFGREPIVPFNPPFLFIPPIFKKPSLDDDYGLPKGKLGKKQRYINIGSFTALKLGIKGKAINKADIFALRPIPKKAKKYFLFGG